MTWWVGVGVGERMGEKRVWDWWGGEERMSI